MDSQFCHLFSAISRMEREKGKLRIKCSFAVSITFKNVKAVNWIFLKNYFLFPFRVRTMSLIRPALKILDVRGTVSWITSRDTLCTPPWVRFTSPCWSCYFFIGVSTVPLSELHELLTKVLEPLKVNFFKRITKSISSSFLTLWDCQISCAYVNTQYIKLT